ncbi:exo-alpha-sialidase [Trypanosoma cruzi]|nr:exo-alpha-sialidase [Trypanosoma cruzi]
MRVKLSLNPPVGLSSWMKRGRKTHQHHNVNTHQRNHQEIGRAQQFPRQTSSSDAIGPSTSADTGKWKKRHPAVVYWRLHCLRHRAWSVVRKYLKARYLSAGIALKVAGSTCPPTRQH